MPTHSDKGEAGSRMRSEDSESVSDAVADAMKAMQDLMNVMQDLIDTLQLLTRLRNQCPYRSRGYRMLNNACIRLMAWFWLQIAEPASCPVPASCSRKRRAA